MLCEVTYYNTTKGYGSVRIIEPGQPCIDCFFYIHSVRDRINPQVGDLVTCDIISSVDRPGRKDARNIVIRKRDEVAKAAQ
jgi:cold shock CspA family protein